MRRRSLDRALAAVGSVSGLARRLLVTPGVVRGWLKKTPRSTRGKPVKGARPGTPEIILRPGDEAVVREARKRLGAKKLAAGLRITTKELRELESQISAAEESPDWKVESLLREIDAAKRKSAEEEQTFNELLKLAGEATVKKVRRAKGGKERTERVAALPKVRSKEGVRSGLRTSGYQWVKAFRRELSPAVIREIEAWSHSFGKGKGHPLWQATALLAQFALHPTKNFEAGQRAGSPKPHELIVQLPHDQAGSFNIEMPVATRAAHLKSEVTADLVERLTVIDDDPLLKSFVYSVRFVNYRRRSPGEKTSIATRERRKRAKKQKWHEARAKGNARRARALRKSKVRPRSTGVKKVSKKPRGTRVKGKKR